MAQSFACRSPCQNPHDGKNELTNRTPTKSSNRRTPVPSTTHALTPAVAPAVALFAAFSSTNSSVIRYSMDDLQRILRTVLDFRLFTLVPAPVIPPLRTMKADVSGFWKLDSQTFIRIKLIWNITISLRSAKIILPPLMLQAQTEFCLRLPFWKIPPGSNGSNTSIR